MTNWFFNRAEQPDREQTSPEMTRLEAALFLSREPTPSRRLAVLADIEDGTRVRTLIRELNQRYQRTGCAFCVVEVAGGYQLRTRPEFASWLFRLQEVPVEVRLTSAAMETLAVIAYKQPILRSSIERIRGAACGDILRQLLDQDLIRITGRLEEPGRPFLYGTTKRFLQVFGLVDISGLPRNETFEPADLGEGEPKPPISSTMAVPVAEQESRQTMGQGTEDSKG